MMEEPRVRALDAGEQIAELLFRELLPPRRPPRLELFWLIASMALCPQILSPTAVQIECFWCCCAGGSNRELVANLKRSALFKSEAVERAMTKVCTSYLAVTKLTVTAHTDRYTSWSSGRWQR